MNICEQHRVALKTAANPEFDEEAGSGADAVEDLGQNAVLAVLGEHSELLAR